jgi:hypothetical protein
MVSYDPRLMNAARYAYQFGLDVVDVLNTDTEPNRLMRTAALMVIGRDNEAEAARSKGRKR